MAEFQIKDIRLGFSALQDRYNCDTVVQDTNDLMKIDILNIKFDDITLDEAVTHASGIVMSSDNKAYIVTPNPEIVWIARRDIAQRTAINNAELVLPDGIGIMLGAHILGTPLKCGRVPGIDFASALFEKIAHSGRSVFLLGAKPGIAEEAGQNLEKAYPGLKIAGVADGYFTDDEQVIAKINSLQPALLLVCLGSPKQELWMAENLIRLNVKLCIGLGGSLDIYAGKVQRAPLFIRKLGLEWLFRLMREPRRIKRMIKLPLFVFVVIWHRIRS